MIANIDERQYNYKRKRLAEKEKFSKTRDDAYRPFKIQDFEATIMKSLC